LFYYRFGNDLFRLAEQCPGTPTFNNQFTLKQTAPMIHYFLIGQLQRLVPVDTYYDVVMLCSAIRYVEQLNPPP
jgi:hypothetical protein